MEKVSVIIPIYQNESTILRCLESVHNQTWTNLEIIVIDDGSTDKGYSIVKKFCDKRLKVFKQVNKGVSFARNFGLKEATGDYLTFVDGDDYIEKDYISSLMKMFRNNKVDLVCDIPDNKDNNKYWTESIKKLSNNFPVLYRDHWINSVCAKLYITSLAKKVQFDENVKIGEDLLYVLSYLKLCNKILLLNNGGYKYIENKKSATHKLRKEDFQNQIFLNNKVINFYLTYLTGNRDKIKYINSVFIKNTLELILKIISSYYSSSKKKKYLLNYTDFDYIKDRINDVYDISIVLQIIRIFYKHRMLNSLIIFGNIYKILKR